MKHAYLIIAHNEYPVLATLLSMLDDERNDVYVHVDKRSEELYEKISSFRMKEGGLFILDSRLEVYWGDISQVEVEYLLLETASMRETYSYYHLLSGTDLPIQDQNDIHSFFAGNSGKEFVGFWQTSGHQRDLKRKVSRYYLFTRQLKRNGSKWHAIAAPCRNLALILQKLVRFQRRWEVEFKKGPNWFSITHAFCQCLIEWKPFVLRRFRYTLCPDEVFVQTVLWNSSFKKDIYCLHDDCEGNMRLIDWNRGSPYTWRKQDYNELVGSDMLFARKFSSGDMDVVNKIKDRYPGTW